MTLAYGAGLAGSLVLLIWYSGDWVLTGWLLAGSLGTITALLLLARALLRGGRAVGTRAGSGWRLALAGLQRRAHHSSVQILVFGLAIMLLGILYLVRTALIEQWRAEVPEDAPNHFVLNVAPHEVEPLAALLERRAGNVEPFFPMTRGRLVAIDGERIDPDAVEGDGTGRLGRERNLSWTGELPEANRVVAGEWWREDPEAPQISLEIDFAREEGISVGQRLTFRVADRRVSATVTNLRQVEWDSMRPNFFILLSPGALEGFPSTYLTSFYLPPDDKAFLNELIRRFPTVTVIEVDALIDQVQSIIRRVTLAVELVLGLVLAAGALVLLASVQSSMDERLREHGLLRALGAPRRRIMAALGVEFGVLGLFAGILAALGAEVTAWVLQTQVFGLEVQVHPWLWLLSPVVGVLLIGTVGTLATRRVVDTPPVTVLRELA